MKIQAVIRKHFNLFLKVCLNTPVSGEHIIQRTKKNALTDISLLRTSHVSNNTPKQIEINYVINYT